MDGKTKEYQAGELDLGQGYDVGDVDFGGAPPKTLGGFAANIPTSAWNLVKNVAGAVVHPINTATALGNVGLGTIESMVPPEFQTVTKHIPYAQAAAQGFKDRYGSIDALLNTAYTDPVGAVADISMLAGGGGGLLRGAGRMAEVPALVKAGQVAGKVSEFTDPLRMAGKGIGKAAGAVSSKVGAEVLGVTTGKGGEAIRQAAEPSTATAFRAALHGGPQAVDNIYDAAMNSLERLRQERAANYRTQLSQVGQQKVAIDTAPVAQALQEQLDAFNIKMLINRKGRLTVTFDDPKLPSPITAGEERGVVQKATDDVNIWLRTPAAQTPLGTDALKQRLANYYLPDQRSSAFTTRMEEAVRGTLQKVPGYIEMERGYAEASDLIKQFKKELSLGGTKGTAVTKLISALNRTNPYRMSVLEALEKYGSPELKAQIAGVALQQVAPAGLMRTVAGARILYGMVEKGIGPDYFLDLLTTSPRFVGEALTYGRQIAGAVPSMRSTVYRPAVAGDFVWDAVNNQLVPAPTPAPPEGP